MIEDQYSYLPAGAAQYDGDVETGAWRWSGQTAKSRCC